MRPSQLLHYLPQFILLIFVIQSSDAQAPPGITIISGPSGIVRQRAVTFHFSGFTDAADRPFAYSLDGALFQFTQANRVTFYNLREGEHTFDVGFADDARSIVRQTFSVRAIFAVEAEPNDAPLSANLLTSEAIMRGVNGSDNDADWYQIELPPRTVGDSEQLQLELHLERPVGVGQTTLSLFDTNRLQESAVLTEVQADATTRQRAQLSLGVSEQTNGLLVRVQAAGENPEAGYELSLTFARRNLRSILEIERNDLPNLATPVVLSASAEIVGGADRPNDLDWYRLDLVATDTPKRLSVTLASPSDFPELSQMSLQIFAGFRATPDNQLGEITLSASNPGPLRLTTAVITGPYLLRVAPNIGDNRSPAATYRVFLQLQDIPENVVYELEPNNRRSRGTPIEIDAEVHGNIWHPDEVDWFRLPIRQPGILSVGLHPVGLDEPPSLSMRLTDANGAEIAAAEGGFLSLDVLPGEYFVEIRGDNRGLETAPTMFRPLPYIFVPFLIQDASHNAVDTILGVGSELVVTLNWVSGREAAFHLTSAAPIPNIRVPMVDTGNGVYVGTYPILPNLQIDAGEILIALGGTNPFRLKNPVTIDSLPPRIAQVRHDGVKPNGELRPIGVGGVANIRLIGEVGATGTFRIEQEQFRVIGDLFDDGAHDDATENDGIYGGGYTVRLGDNVSGATVVGRLEDRAGNVTEEVAPKPIIFDTEPPSITGIQLSVTFRPGHTVIQPQRNDGITLLTGERLTVRLVGEVGGQAEFDFGTLHTGVSLFDDGTHDDLQSNDGIYTNVYTVQPTDNTINAVITGRLRDIAGNTNQITSPTSIDIDTTPPSIAKIEHNATNRPLIEGDRLIVRLHGEPGGMARFDIGRFRAGLILVDDGSGVDEIANDGIYTGTYEVSAGDNAVDAGISGQLIDVSGNHTDVRSAVRVTIDAVPPEAVTGVTAVDRPNDQGNVLKVTWNPATTTDFARYQIYREAAPIRSTFGLIPIPQNLVVREGTMVEIPMPRNNFDYYIAVTAVDLAGNVSPISVENGSSAGPVRALDNIPPPAIVGVTAENRPNDNGKTLIVSWAPIAEIRPAVAQDSDFTSYRIYVEEQPIVSVSGLAATLTVADPNATQAAVTVPTDDTNFYLAVTAIDENGNESSLDLTPDASTFGPVLSHDETPPEPVIDVVAIDTPGDNGRSLTVGWTPQINVGVSHYQVFLSTRSITADEDLVGIEPIRADEDNTDVVSISTPTDDFGFHIAVTAVDFGGNTSSLDPDGGSVFGPVQSVSNTVRASAKMTISAGFDPNTKITLSPHAARSGQTIDIFIPTDEILLQQLDEANHFLDTSHIDAQTDPLFLETVVEFVLDSGTAETPDSTASLAVPAELTLSYPAETQPPLTPEIEGDLRIFRLNTKGRIARWDLVSGVQRVNREQKTVTAFVESLTTFRIARLKLPDTLKDVVVVPNPFIPSQSLSKRVTFLNLTATATLEIYTLSGERVWSTTVENTTGRATWDGRNQSGLAVASGLYIYVIQSETDKVVGRLMVMR